MHDDVLILRTTRSKQASTGVIPPRGMPAAPVDPRTIPTYRTPPEAPPPTRSGLTAPSDPRLPPALHLQPGDGALDLVAPTYAAPQVDLTLPVPLPWEGPQTHPFIGLDDDHALNSPEDPQGETDVYNDFGHDDVRSPEWRADATHTIARPSTQEYQRPYPVDPAPILKYATAIQGTGVHAHPTHAGQPAPAPGGGHHAHDGGIDPHDVPLHAPHTPAGDLDSAVAHDVAELMDHDDASTADKDLVLWRKWYKSAPNPEDRDPELLEALITRLKPLTQRQIRSLKRTRVPASAIEQASRRSLVESLTDFDPSKNVKLSTFVTLGQRRVLRFVQQRANTARITEDRGALVGKYQRAVNHLADQQGFTPTDEQVAQYMKVPVKTIQNLKQENRKDLIASASPVADPYLDETPEHREILQLLPASLTREQLTIFEYTMGLNGKPKVTSTGELARLTGWSQAKVVQLRTKIAAIIDRYRE